MTHDGEGGCLFDFVTFNQQSQFAWFIYKEEDGEFLTKFLCSYLFTGTMIYLLHFIKSQFMFELVYKGLSDSHRISAVKWCQSRS